MDGERELIQLYETAVKELYREIAYREGVGTTTAYQRKLLERVRAILKELKRKTPSAVEAALKPAWAAGVKDFVADVKPAGFALEPRINWRQLSILIQNTTDQLTLATNRVGRMWEDTIRRAGIEATRHKLATRQTVDQMRRQLLQELMGIAAKTPPQEMGTNKDGQAGIKTRRGVMRLDTYAALVARSTTAEAQNASKLSMAAEYGHDLVRFTAHSPKCARCAQFEGRVYSLTREVADGKYKGPDGEALRFPYLYETAFADGYNNIHPNCRHRLVVVLASLMTPAELAEWSRKSMQPFEDTRSERDRKAYQAAQAKNRARWQDRRQWERYRAALPDQTPMSFGVFRSMKKANAQGWRDLQADYRMVVNTADAESRNPHLNTQTQSDMVTVDTQSNEVDAVQYIGQITPSHLGGAFHNLSTQEVVLTLERQQHIIKRHGDDYPVFMENVHRIVNNPDLVLLDEKNAQTVMYVGGIDEGHLNIIIKLILADESLDIKNSIMTAYRLGDKTLRRLKKKNRTLYSKEYMCYT